MQVPSAQLVPVSLSVSATLQRAGPLLIKRLVVWSLAIQDTITATTPAPGKFHKQGICIIIYLLQMCDCWMASWPTGQLMLTMRAGTNNRTAVYENITNESDGEGLVEVCWTCLAATACQSILGQHSWTVVGCVWVLDRKHFGVELVDEECC